MSNCKESWKRRKLDRGSPLWLEQGQWLNGRDPIVLKPRQQRALSRVGRRTRIMSNNTQ